MRKSVILASLSLGLTAWTPGHADSIRETGAGRTTVRTHGDTVPDATEDEAFATRGFIATRKDPLIRDDKGNVVADLDAFAFLNDPATSQTVDASLLQHAKLLNKTGLFEVADGVYQVRNFDAANFTFVRGQTGWIVIDAGLVPATAKAAYDLVSHNLGRFPIVAVIYTHAHIDHFGGVTGLATQADADAGRVEIIAPEGFSEHTISEFLVAGTSMLRRAQYQGGTGLPINARGYVTFGIGNVLGKGAWSLIAPTVTISKTGTERLIDGVPFVFQLTPGTEAPAEMNIFMPTKGVLDMAENGNGTMHQIYTLRGAQIRDAAFWAEQLEEARKIFGDKSTAMILSHGWPRFGTENIKAFLQKHADMYRYIHDQTVRMANNGLTGEEIANRIALPASLHDESFNRGYYGSVIHNSRGVYQKYVGWYDGNPVHLAAFDPVKKAALYIDAMGGRDQVMDTASTAAKSGELSWAAVLYDKIVMTDHKDQQARNALAAVYSKLGYAQENPLWRNEYLTAALELTKGIPKPTLASLDERDILANLPTPYILQMLSVRLNPTKLGNHSTSFLMQFTDRQEQYRIDIANDVFHFDKADASATADVVIRGARTAVLGALIYGKGDAAIAISGNADLVPLFASWFDHPMPTFPIVWRDDE